MRDYSVVYQIGGKTERDALIMRKVIVRAPQKHLWLILRLATLMDHLIESINPAHLRPDEEPDVVLVDERFNGVQMRRWVNGIKPDRRAYEKYLEFESKFHFNVSTPDSFEEWAATKWPGPEVLPPTLQERTNS